MTGKEKCNELRQIRRQIAELNDIDLPMEDCTYEGPCKGTCPKCEEELRLLEDALSERQKDGVEVKLKGVASEAAEKWGAMKPTGTDDFDRQNTPGKTLVAWSNECSPGEKNPPSVDGSSHNDDVENVYGMLGPLDDYITDDFGEVPSRNGIDIEELFDMCPTFDDDCQKPDSGKESPGDDDDTEHILAGAPMPFDRYEDLDF